MLDATPSWAPSVERREPANLHPFVRVAQQTASNPAVAFAMPVDAMAVSTVRAASPSTPRAAAGAGCRASNTQFGQSGKTLAPELHLAVGISEAIHRFTSIKHGCTIAAVTHDVAVPIFEVAGIALVSAPSKIAAELEPAG